MKALQENSFLVRIETIHVHNTERGLGNVNGTSSVPSVSQRIRLPREGKIELHFNREFNPLAIKPCLGKTLACCRAIFRDTYLPVNRVQSLDFIFATVFLEVSIQVILPLLSIDALPTVLFDIMADVREEYFQASDGSL